VAGVGDDDRLTSNSPQVGIPTTTTAPTRTGPGVSAERPRRRSRPTARVSPHKSPSRHRRSGRRWGAGGRIWSGECTKRTRSCVPV